MVFGGSKLDRDERNVQPIANADGAAGQLADPPYRAGTIAVHPQIMQRALPRTKHMLVWGEARVRPKPGVPPQAGPLPQSSSSYRTPSSSLLPSAAAAPKPQSYIEALQSEPAKAKVASYSSSPSYGLQSKQTISGARPGSGGSGGYGLESDIVKKSSSSSLTSAAKPKSGGLYSTLDDDDEDGYGLFPDDELEAPKKATSAVASALSSQRYGRVSTPDGPSTPRSSSPSGAAGGPLAAAIGGLSGSRPGSGGASRPLTSGSATGGLYGSSTSTVSSTSGYKAPVAATTSALAGSRPGSGGGGYGLASDLKKPSSPTPTTSAAKPAALKSGGGGYGLDSDLKSTSSGIGKSSYY